MSAADPVPGTPRRATRGERRAAAASRRLLGRLGGRRVSRAPLVVIGPDGRPVAAVEDPVDPDDVLGHLETAPTPRTPPLATDVFDLVERERMRLAREIHDGPAQILTNLVLKTEIIGRLLAADPKRAGTELVEFRAMARTALDETRRLIFDLRPMSLDDLGLAPALRRLVRELGDRSGIATTFHMAGEERRIPRRVEAMLFRVVQEAVANAARHANAGSIEVTLTVGPQHATATVRDDGRGFDVAAATARAARTQRLGLCSMRERAAQHDAVVDISSRPGAGTRVRVSVRL